VTLHEIQEASYRRASAGILSSWPPERSLGAAELEAFLVELRYCVLATATGRGHPQARPVAFVPFGETLWFATGASGRLKNLTRRPWISVVISEGDGGDHRAVIADGAVTVSDTPPAGLLELWESRFGSRAEWAVAWIELRPERVYSYTSA
jgi:nitroimidazol reductase NimA-like FMN-containing flavoprotein (pyridoxamine 5'-phosphate oxidase superfamily)